MTDLEEGELDNSDPEDQPKLSKTIDKPVSSAYNVLERPVSSVPTSSSGYRTLTSRNKASSDSYSEDDDEGDSGLWKNKQEKYFRKKQQTNMDTSQPSNLPAPRPTKKVNNVWGSVLTEQDLSQTLVQSANVVRSSVNFNERTVESYDYRNKYKDPRVDSVSILPNVTEVHDPFEAVLKANKVAEGRSVIDYEDTVDISNKKRGKKRKSEFNDRGGKNVYDRLGPKKKATMTVSEMDVNSDMEPGVLVDKISDCLNEPKKELIERVVEHMGKEVAIRILQFTRDVENGGGMLTFDGTRRRTAGGVYLQLTKQQPEFTSDVKKQIFKEEHDREMQRKKEKRNRKRQNKKMRKNREKGDNQSHSRSSSKGSKGDDSEEEMDDDVKDKQNNSHGDGPDKTSPTNGEEKSKNSTSRHSRYSKHKACNSDSSDEEEYSHRSKEFNFEEELAEEKRRIAEKTKAEENDKEMADSKENLEGSFELDAQESGVVDIPLEG